MPEFEEEFSIKILDIHVFKEHVTKIPFWKIDIQNDDQKINITSIVPEERFCNFVSNFLFEKGFEPTSKNQLHEYRVFGIHYNLLFKRLNSTQNGY